MKNEANENVLLDFFFTDLDLVQDVPVIQTQEEEEKNMKCKFSIIIYIEFIFQLSHTHSSSIIHNNFIFCFFVLCLNRFRCIVNHSYIVFFET